MLLTAIYLLLQINAINENTKTIAEHPFVVSNTVKDFKIELYKSQFLIRDLRFTDKDKVKDSINSEIKKLDKKLYNDLKIINSQYLGGKSDILDVISALKDWRSKRLPYNELLRSGDNDSIDVFIGNVLNSGFLNIILKINVIQDFAQNKLNEIVKTQADSSDSSYNISISVLLASVFIVIFLIWYISKSLSRPIKEFVDNVNSMTGIENRTDKKFVHEEEILLNTLNELKTAFRKIESMNITLEEKVRQRTLELQSVNEYLENLFYYANAPIIVWDTQFRITRFNPAFEKITGRKADEILGKHIEILFPETQVDFSMGHIKKAQQGERWEAVELDILNINGDISTLLWNSAHVYGSDGKTIVSTIAQGHDITNQKKIFNDLIISEDKFRYLFEYSNVGKSFTLPSGEINVNESFCRMLGYTKEELNNQKWQDLSHPDDVTENQKFIDGIITGKKDSTRFIKRYIHKTGSIVWTDVSTVVRRDKNGNVLYFMTSVLDITAQKQAEDMLIKLSSRQEAIIEAVPEIIMEVDINKIYTWANENGKLFFGDDVIGKEASFYFKGEQEVYKYVKPLFEGHENIIYIESWQRRKDGEIRLLAWWCKVLKDHEGVVTGALSTARDITERFMYEEALKNSEKRIREVLDSTPFPVAIVDHQDNNILYWSKSAQTLFGHTAPSAPEWYEMAYPDEAYRANVVERWKPAIEIARETRTPVNAGEYNVTCKDGAVRTCELYANFLSDILIVTFNDITDRKKAEDALKESNKELEQFAYVASHDLQEPLRMVSSYTQLLAKRYKDKLDTDAQEFISYAVGGAMRMQMLINDLLNYSRLNTRKKQMALTDCNSVLGKVRINLSVFIEEKSALITSSELPKIMVDETQFTQLLQNLISNGIKYHGNQPPHVHVSATEKANEWVFRIKDNGIGIENEFYERIFGIFQRLHSRDEYSGTGIGLAICKRIIDRHGGKIWLESKVGKGTSFYFSLPKTQLESNN